MESYLSVLHVLIKDFGAFVNQMSSAVRDEAQLLAAKLGRPIQYVPSSDTSKEQLARQIAERDKISEGLICILNAVEPCQSYSVRGNRQTKMIELRVERRKCTHLYFYFEHPRFGFMHLRLQTWFPFQVNLCINGRHWLGRQLDAEGIAYQKKDNTFVHVANYARAQELLDEQMRVDWSKELNAIVTQVHPLHRRICRPLDLKYYWSASDTEYATDVVFKDSSTLASLYPRFVHHAMSTFHSPDVMRFLGRYVPAKTGRVFGQFEGEIISDCKTRPEGVRVKHSLNGNSIKVYDKASTVLRTETTILYPEEFKTFRRPEGEPKAKKRCLPMRRGLADLRRRAEVSHRSNHRYLEALASASGAVPLGEMAQKMCCPVKQKRRRYRALNPWGPQDAKLLKIVSRGEFAINGFRNRDIRQAFFEGRCHPSQLKRQVGQISRRLRLLRAHGLIKKVSHTHRYIVTARGRTAITALIAANNADVEQLTKIAA